VIDIIQRAWKVTMLTYLVVDPWAKPSDVKKEYQIEISQSIPEQKFDAIILAVGHNEFSNIDIRNMLKDNSVLYDVKGFIT
jgi:UDP-N-acetyl-D-galactosamine dehydrogenase